MDTTKINKAIIAVILGGGCLRAGSNLKATQHQYTLLRSVSTDALALDVSESLFSSMFDDAKKIEVGAGLEIQNVFLHSYRFLPIAVWIHELLTVILMHKNNPLKLQAKNSKIPLEAVVSYLVQNPNLLDSEQYVYYGILQDSVFYKPVLTSHNGELIYSEELSKHAIAGLISRNRVPEVFLMPRINEQALIVAIKSLQELPFTKDIAVDSRFFFASDRPTKPKNLRDTMKLWRKLAYQDAGDAGLEAEQFPLSAEASILRRQDSDESLEGRPFRSKTSQVSRTLADARSQVLPRLDAEDDRIAALDEREKRIQQAEALLRSQQAVFASQQITILDQQSQLAKKAELLQSHEVLDSELQAAKKELATLRAAMEKQLNQPILDELKKQGAQVVDLLGRAEKGAEGIVDSADTIQQMSDRVQEDILEEVNDIGKLKELIKTQLAPSLPKLAANLSIVLSQTQEDLQAASDKLEKLEEENTEVKELAKQIIGHIIESKTILSSMFQVASSIIYLLFNFVNLFLHIEPTVQANLPSSFSRLMFPVSSMGNQLLENLQKPKSK